MSSNRRNPRPTEDDLCAVCGAPYASLHEVYYGTANRQISIRHGFQERLCPIHHNEPGFSNPHHNRSVDLALREKHQRLFEETHTRDEFMKLIGRNYL